MMASIKVKNNKFGLLALILILGIGFNGPVFSKPKPSGEKQRTIEVTQKKVAVGKALFAACSACHGPTGDGKTGMGPRLNSRSFLAAASDHFLMETISKGRAGTTMIGWESTQNAQQIESIVAYIRSLNPVSSVTLDHSKLKGNAKKGEEIYGSICAACHGKNGGGYMETANGTGIGRKAFLDVADNGFLRYIIKYGKDQTMMRPFSGSRMSVANLNDTEIEDVIAYLRKQA